MPRVVGSRQDLEDAEVGAAVHHPDYREWTLVEPNRLADDPGSRPSALVQNPSLITTTAGPPARASSGVNPRPTMGFTPSIGSSSCVASSAWRRIASPPSGE